MQFELIPILEKLRELYLIPPGEARFAKYLEITINGAQRSRDVEVPPLIAANPMAKAHALECVERWIELGAEEETRQMLEQANTGLKNVPFPKPIKVGLTVLDDLKGGWTNRTFSDASRFKTGTTLQKTGWLSVSVWTSETPELEELRLRTLESTARAAHASKHGDPQTLNEMMRQEGTAAAFAGRTNTFDAEELEYSRAVIATHLESTHQATTIACLYGDDAAKSVGYTALGLSKHAGFEVALADALKQQNPKEQHGLPSQPT